MWWKYTNINDLFTMSGQWNIYTCSCDQSTLFKGAMWGLLEFSLTSFLWSSFVSIYAFK
jgi:hypothetical protein